MANIKWSAFASGGEMQVGDQTVGLRAGDNYRFDFPSTGIKDSSGNYLVGWSSPGALAVNYLQINSAIAGSSPYIIPAGTDVDIDMLITSKGNGDINLDPAGTGVINAITTLLLSTNSPTTDLEAASKGYVDSVIPTYPISLANGGTNASLTASNGGIFYSTATAGAILSGTATANQIILSGSNAAPSWSTATYPSTTTANQLLYSSANNTIGGLSSGANGVLVTSNTSVPSILAGPGVTGNMLSSNAAAAPSWSTAVYSDTYAINNLLYASGANTVSGLATANNGVLVTDNTGIPSISSTLPTAVQGNITSVGTITSGTWNGGIIMPTYGGTGVNNGSSTITIGGNFAMIGAFTFDGTLTGNTAVTFPTSGTLATTSQIPSLPLSLANGGTSASLTASNGGIVYSGAAALGILAGTATANQIILSGSNTTPSWSTATYPSTTTANQLLYSSSANTIAGLTSANNGVLVTSNTGVPSILAGPGTTGNILQSNAAAAPSFSTATFPSTAGTTGTILRSNGTNWVNSTSTFADTYSASTLLYANGANTVQGLATANSAMLYTNSSGVPAWTASATNGQLLIGSTGASPALATLTAGDGIEITNAAASITIASSAVVQYVVATSSATDTTTSTSLVSSSLSASITPKNANNRILVVVSCYTRADNPSANSINNYFVGLAINRTTGTPAVISGTYQTGNVFATAVASSNQVAYDASMISATEIAGSTSAHTYELQFASGSGSGRGSIFGANGTAVMYIFELKV